MARNAMSLDLSPQSLRSLIPLAEKREALRAEIAKIETEISRIAAGGDVEGKMARGRRKTPATATPKSDKTGKPRKRGAVKELILAGLKSAGEAGIAVKDLAEKLGLKPQNVHVWFHTTGKKNPNVEKAGKGTYRFKG